MGPAEDDLAAGGGATLGDIGAMLSIAARRNPDDVAIEQFVEFSRDPICCFMQFLVEG